MEIQIDMINCQKELEELEYDREVLAGRIAVHKATRLANAKKRGVEERKRGEEKISNGAVQFQLKNHQNELEVSMARNKTFALIHRNDSISDTPIRRGVQFAAISGSEEYMVANEEGGKKARFEAPSDMVGEEDKQQSFMTYQQILESQGKHQKD
jgi:hypothetical protein